MFCPNCGNELKPGDTFCGKCGTKIGADSSGTARRSPARWAGISGHRAAVPIKKPLLLLVPVLVAIIAIIAILRAIGSSSGSDLSGYYTDGKTYSTFPISALEFSEDGSVTFHMDHTYYGEYSGKDGKYKLSVKEASSEFGANITVEEVKNGLRITAEENEDGSLTVYVKGKGSYMYLGPESEVFRKEGESTATENTKGQNDEAKNQEELADGLPMKEEGASDEHEKIENQNSLVAGQYEFSSIHWLLTNEPLSTESCFSEERAWVQYNDENENRFFSLIDKNGFERYSIQINDKLDGGTKRLNLSPVRDGLTCISYYNAESSDIVTWVQIIDKDGNELYRVDGEKGRCYNIAYMGEGLFCLGEQNTGFDNNNGTFHIIDQNGNVLRDVDELMFGSGDIDHVLNPISLGDGYFIFYGGIDYDNLIYNRNEGTITSGTISIFNSREQPGEEKYIDLMPEYPFYKGKSVVKYPYEYSYYIVSLETYRNAETIAAYGKTGGVSYPPGMDLHIDTLGEGLIYCTKNPQFFGFIENAGDDFFYTNINHFDGREGFYDLDRNFVCSLPQYSESVKIAQVFPFSGDYACLILEGADERHYMTVINRQGQQQYEPIRLNRDRVGYTREYHGYVYATIEPDEVSYDVIISPEGNLLMPFEDDLSEIGDDANLADLIAGGMLIQRDDPNTKSQYSYVSLDGKTVVDSVIRLNDRINPDEITRNEVLGY